MVAILDTIASQALPNRSFSAGSGDLNKQTNSRLSSGNDTVSLSADAKKRLESGKQALAALKQSDNILSGQRIDFLQKQLKELNEQIRTLRGLLEFANADQARTLQFGIQDVGTQLEGLGSDITALINSSSRSVSIESVQGRFSQDFNAAASTGGVGLAYSQSLKGEFSFTKIVTEEQNTSVSIDSSGELIIDQTTTRSETIVSEINIESSESFVSGSITDNPLEELVAAYDQTANSFDSLVGDTLDALNLNDGGINELISFLDNYIEQNKINFLA
jgi:hypothetical protein